MLNPLKWKYEDQARLLFAAAFGALPGSGTGRAREVPLSNPPGTNWADRLMDAQDAKDREALILQEAQRRGLQKAAEKPN